MNDAYWEGCSHTWVTRSEDDDSIYQACACGATNTVAKTNPCKQCLSDRQGDNMKGLIQRDIIAEAVRLASTAHINQVDKSGVSYILHPLRVMAMGKDDTERVVGVLHDVLEDSPYSYQEMSRDFGPVIADAVDAMTKQKKESYKDYIYRVKRNPLATAVKLNDLADNLSPDRAAGLTDSLKERYEFALAILTNKLTHPDIPVYMDFDMKKMPKGIYLGFFHGRDFPDQELDDWGSQGPVLGPFKYWHMTYKVNGHGEFDGHYPLLKKHYYDTGLIPHCTSNDEFNIVFHEDMAVLGGKYYGDISVFYNEVGY